MRRVPPEMFRFTTGERAGLHSAVLDAFGAAGEHLETALGLDGVRERLRTVGWLDAVEDEELHAALKRLVWWGLLDVGWPNSAAVHFVRLLAEHGADLRHHGDFDGEGIRIAAHVFAKTSARPWRMSAADCRDAVARS
ncbi:DUF2397 family protein, partial [Streptomyces sp. NPDC002690]